MTKQIKIAVGLPHYQGKSSFEHCRMWMEFGAVLNESSERFKLVCFALIDECGIDRARNKCVEKALEADADWLLMLDADTWISDGGDLLQMISDADKLGATIVGAAVPRRGQGPVTYMAYRCVDNRDAGGGIDAVSCSEAYMRATTFDPLLNRDPEDQPLAGTYFCPVDAMATACMAINLRHTQFMDHPFFKFTDDESEDLDFCRRVREMRGGWMKLDDFGRPSENGVQVAWHGHILVDKRIEARHLNRPVILRGIERS